MKFPISLLTLCLAGGCASLGPVNPLRPLERKLMFHPTTAVLPADGNDVETVQIAVENGESISGLYLPHADAKLCLLYCHGNAGNIVDRLPRLRALRDDHHMTVMGFDYRGYGASDGRPDEANMYADARTARRWLARRHGIQEKDIVLLGRSLGGGVAVELAAADDAKGLILESTFSSISDVGSAHIKWLPVSWLVSQKFDSAKKIADYTGPLLQSHGSRDQVIPYELGQRLHEAAASANKSFVTTAAGHNDLPSQDYNLRLAQFLQSLHSPLVDSD